MVDKTKRRSRRQNNKQNNKQKYRQKRKNTRYQRKKKDLEGGKIIPQVLKDMFSQRNRNMTKEQKNNHDARLRAARKDKIDDNRLFKIAVENKENIKKIFKMLGVIPQKDSVTIQY